MIELRLEGRPIEEIKKYFMDFYQIQIFRGDLYDFYDQVIYNLRSTYEISKTIQVHTEIESDVKDIPPIIDRLID